MQSKFRFFSYLIPVFVLFFVLTTFLIIIGSIVSLNFILLILVIPFMMSLLNLIYNLKYQCNKISINKTQLIISRYFGLGKTYYFNHQNIQLFPSWEHVGMGSGNKILVYVRGRRIADISDLIFSNYVLLLKGLKKHKKLESFKSDGLLTRFKIAAGI